MKWKFLTRATANIYELWRLTTQLKQNATLQFGNCGAAERDTMFKKQKHWLLWELTYTKYFSVSKLRATNKSVWQEERNKKNWVAFIWFKVTRIILRKFSRPNYRCRVEYWSKHYLISKVSKMCPHFFLFTGTRMFSELQLEFFFAAISYSLLSVCLCFHDEKTWCWNYVTDVCWTLALLLSTVNTVNEKRSEAKWRW